MGDYSPVYNVRMAPKSILLFTHDEVLRASRLALLNAEGHSVDFAISDTEAITMLRAKQYSLILIGRDTRGEKVPLDERISGTGTVARAQDGRHAQLLRSNNRHEV